MRSSGMAGEWRESLYGRVAADYIEETIKEFMHS